MELILSACLVSSVLAFFLGKMYAAQKDATDTSRVALFASLIAMTDAKALKNSTVINRIVEKYNPIIPPSENLSKPAQEMRDELERVLEVEETDYPKGRERRSQNVSDFNEEDLV